MRIRALFRHFRRKEDGTATVEFAILVPLLFAIFFSSIESGVMMVRWTSIDRASDMVIRNLRLGKYASPTATSLRREICNNTFLIENCFENTVVEIRRIDRATFLMPAVDAPCVTRDTNVIVPVTQVVPGQQNDLMLIRVCVTVNALMPGSAYSLPLNYDAQGGYALAISSVYVNEPS